MKLSMSESFSNSKKTAKAESQARINDFLNNNVTHDSPGNLAAGAPIQPHSNQTVQTPTTGPTAKPVVDFDDVLHEIETHTELFEDMNDDLQKTRRKKNRNQLARSVESLRTSVSQTIVPDHPLDSDSVPKSIPVTSASSFLRQESDVSKMSSRGAGNRVTTERVADDNVADDVVIENGVDLEEEGAEGAGSLYERALAGELGAITAIANLKQVPNLAQEKFSQYIHSEKTGFDRDIDVGIGSVLVLIRSKIFKASLEPFVSSHGGMTKKEGAIEAIRAFLRLGGVIKTLEDFQQFMDLLSDIGDIVLPMGIQTEIEDALMTFMKGKMQSFESQDQLTQFVSLISQQIMATSLMINLTRFELEDPDTFLDEEAQQLGRLSEGLNELDSIDLLEEKITVENVLAGLGEGALPGAVSPNVQIDNDVDSPFSRQKREEVAQKAASISKSTLKSELLPGLRAGVSLDGVSESNALADTKQEKPLLTDRLPADVKAEPDRDVITPILDSQAIKAVSRLANDLPMSLLDQDPVFQAQLNEEEADPDDSEQFLTQFQYLLSSLRQSIDSRIRSNPNRFDI